MWTIMQSCCCMYVVVDLGRSHTPKQYVPEGHADSETSHVWCDVLTSLLHVSLCAEVCVC